MTALTRSLVLSAHRSYLVPRIFLRKMSVQAALAKLPSPLKDLVFSASQDAATLAGKTEKDQAEVVEWIDKVGQGDVAKEEGFKVCGQT